jgi:hypothetical protein
MPTLNKLRKWLVNYDNSKHKEPRLPNEAWLNSRYGPQNMDWKTAQQIYLPSVNTTVGKCWNRLRKLWRSYEISNSNGESTMQQCYEINRYQVALDLPRTRFEQLEGIVSDYEFENQDQETEVEPHPEEWSSLDEELLREEQEEQEAEAEEYEQRKADVFSDW